MEYAELGTLGKRIETYATFVAYALPYTCEYPRLLFRLLALTNPRGSLRWIIYLSTLHCCAGKRLLGRLNPLLIETLQYIHTQGIIHRDIKPDVSYPHSHLQVE